MALKAGSYQLTSYSGKLHVYTYKEGFLGAVAHDLLIDVTGFTVRLNVPEGGNQSATVEAEILANSLKVVCAMKDGQRNNDALKEKDKADIEEATSKDVLHPSKYPIISFHSTDIQGNGDVYHVKGDLTLHGATHPLEFDAKTTNGKDLKGRFTILQKDFGVKPYKALLGTLKVKNEIDVAFDLSLS